VAFTFRRIQGDPIAFGRVWDEVEGCLLRLAGSLFFDNMNKCLNAKINKSKDHSSLCDGCSVTECAAGSLRGPRVFKALCVQKML